MRIERQRRGRAVDAHQDRPIAPGCLLLDVPGGADIPEEVSPERLKGT